MEEDGAGAGAAQAAAADSQPDDVIMATDATPIAPSSNEREWKKHGLV